MTENSPSIYRKAARIQSVVCGFLFSVFSVVYLYVFQPYVMEALHFSLAHGKTQYAPLASALTLTLGLMLLQVGICRLFRLEGLLRTVAYLPSYLSLAALTDVGKGIYTSDYHTFWHWLLPLLLLLIAGGLMRARHAMAHNGKEWMASPQLNERLMLLLGFSLMTVWVGNADPDFHHETEAEHFLNKRSYDRALQAGVHASTASRTLTALRALALTHTGELGERLFEFPQSYGADGLFFSSDSLEHLRYTNDSVYFVLGGCPYNGQENIDFLHSLCYQDKGKYTALDYYLSALLLEKRTADFAQVASDFFESTDSLPRHYQEALARYAFDFPQSRLLPADSAWVKQYAGYLKAGEAWNSIDERRKALRETYGHTYWWYVDFQPLPARRY
ncbi:MAG: DUF6057 family protein [Phocaeicola plebeius]|nr:DUF6057 family protein [Phocaeicola plebeius]